ncbi:MAG: Lon family ATP-dependent protease [Anaerovibrio sp.]|uniref:Lon family ATP-dependent protease n=1 Tax=Anaerovibrio sp. TaxID=1872532 RepID=UPI0025FC0CA9|nr:Lon family ATP-dependent protease [Anaerovibrio sp.]MCR5177112.1 Lon family ATP-dependent protease [Anaerovibrio sp.]
MKNFFSKLLNLKTEDKEADVAAAKNALSKELPPKDELDRKVDALFSLLVDYYGSDRLVIKAGKMDALQYIRSPERGERILALQRIISDNPTIKDIPSDDEASEILDRLTEQFSDILARRSVEDDLEKKVAERLEENHLDYVKDIKMQLLKEEKKNIESPLEQKKREQLEKLEEISLTQSVMELLRPTSTDEIVGQSRAVDSLLAKLSSPYPQHLILYGPPGVGKTTAARLVLEEAKKRRLSPFAEDAPFIETDGTTLRWDPRDMTNPLLGSVHDPIYQGARKDLADVGIPEPKPGLVTDAHGGILFIDEIGEMDMMLQNKLLKILEDKRAYFESAYYDPADDKIPPYIKKLFDEGAPADFVLIGATTRESSHINPALRSRCAEIYFEPLTPANIQEIISNAAEKLSATLGDGVAKLISEYTIEGRKAINILADAYSLALERNTSDTDSPVAIEKADIYKVAQVSRLSPYITKKASDRMEIGHIFGLGVAGFLGSVIEIEAIAFKAREEGKGTVRFNETAGSMAKDSVFNAASVIRMLTGKDMHDYDIHINVIGGGNIDGPSAGTAILTAILSAITRRPIRQDTAITGEISLHGKVRPVGGVFEKAYGAKQAGIINLIIPAENEKDIPKNHLGLNIHTVKTAKEAFELLLGPEEQTD